MSETKLLGILLPNIPELQEILSTIRKKYHIPPVLPENVQLTETLFQEQTAEEWKAIRDEIETELRLKIPLLPANLGKIYQDLMELSSKSPERATRPNYQNT